MRPKFGNSSMFAREVIITSILTRKPNFFEGCSWFRLYNLGLALGIVLKYLKQCGKRVKTKLQKVFETSSYVCANYRGKTGRGPFCTSPPPILNRAKFISNLSLITLKVTEVYLFLISIDFSQCSYPTLLTLPFINFNMRFFCLIF